MTDKKQPEALRLADEFDWWLARGITIEPRLYDAATELRRLHAENESLRAERERNLHSIRVNNEIINKKNAELESLSTGYAAARLEIESLRTRCVEPAGEYPALPKFNAGAVATEASGKVEMYPAAFKQLLSEIFDRGAREAAGAWRAYVDADRAMRAAQPAGAQQPGAAVLIGALEDAQRAINSMKVEAETAAQGDEQMMLEACETISNEGLQADMAIRAALESHGQAPAQAAPADTEALDVLRAFAEGRINHINEGLCPDSITGPNSRDPDCRVCRALDGVAPAAVAGPSDAETVDVVGVRANGEHVNLGKIAMPPRMKAREIAVEYFGSFDDDDDSDAELCFWAIESFLDWLVAQGWTAAPTTQPVPQQEAQGPGVKHGDAHRTAQSWGLLDAQASAYNQWFNGERCAAYEGDMWSFGRAAWMACATQPSPASQGDALDAARYRWLRDSTEWEPFDSAWLNKHDIYGCPTLAMDVAIDVARAAQEGKSHG